MAQKQPIKTLLEASALFMVVAFPLFAIGWYLLNGDSSNTVNTDPIVPASVTASATIRQTTPQTVTPMAAMGTITVNNPSAIPQKVSAGQIIPFSFTIENTGTAASFLYKVSVRWSSGEVNVIDENSITLAAGSSRELSEALKFETTTEKGTVIIQLLPSGTSINFAMPRR
jgi:hypothetical protein